MDWEDKLPAGHSYREDGGFTLIEMVAVVVLLGILAAIALPNFINLRQDARQVMLNTAVAATKNASEFVFLKGQLQGISNGKVDIGGEEVLVVEGYMQGRGADAFLKVVELSGITTGLDWDELCPTSFCTHGNEQSMPDVPGANGGRGVYVWPIATTVADSCYLYYYNREDGSPPLIGKIASGC
ncbi:hypothetical protein ST37_13640 [Vibrio sp. qd031]|uniref:type II secretion system protein n=1 Tax=Vibrio sp. qd031 TaxID=1603038 RepID=UPI000A0F466B|nr:type II secretion system protein [Vibrio sp. qd031]ORT49440.1 hypothetical protein ST37_13640 [Vibrio sp. qd031]